MPVPRVLRVDGSWGELAEVIQFIGGRLDEISIGKSIAMDGAGHTDDWDEGYLNALSDIVIFIQHLHSRAAA